MKFIGGGASHTHAASDIASGDIAAARLALIFSVANAPIVKTADYTLLTVDVGDWFAMDSASEQDFVVDGSLNLAPGQSITLGRWGAGEVPIVASGATVNSSSGLRLRAQYSVATLYCYSTDVYWLIGDLKV